MNRVSSAGTAAPGAEPEDLDAMSATAQIELKAVALGLSAEEALSRERRLLRTIIDSLPINVYAKDEQSRFIACNARVAQIMGTTPANAIGRTDRDFYPAEMAARFLADEQAVLRTGEPMIDREELVLDRTTGEVRHFTSTKVPLRDDAGRIIGIVGIGHDITERKEAERRIQFLATHDSLTGLPNRGAFNDALAAAIDAGRAGNTRFAILFVDLDDFKLINDSLGHDAGDELLKQTAARLRASVRTGDLVARLGGDEFVLLCREPPYLGDLEGLAARVLEAAIRPFDLLGQERRVSASIGVAVYPDHGTTEDSLMKSADTAMYAAKQEGKSTFRLFSR